MFPFDEPHRPGRPIAALIGSLLLCGSVLGSSNATADATAPVINIVAPVLDIQFGTADLKSEARVEQLPRRTKITLDSTVLFPKDSAKINARAEGRLREAAQQLKGRGPGHVRVTGYTDDLGSAAHGLTLSRQRAKAVAAVLSRELPGRDFPMTTVGKGEQEPAVPNNSEANRRINRRVVVLDSRR